jgi:hypothetical protein
MTQGDLLSAFQARGVADFFEPLNWERALTLAVALALAAVALAGLRQLGRGGVALAGLSWRRLVRPAGRLTARVLCWPFRRAPVPEPEPNPVMDWVLLSLQDPDAVWTDETQTLLTSALEAQLGLEPMTQQDSDRVWRLTFLRTVDDCMNVLADLDDEEKGTALQAVIAARGRVEKRDRDARRAEVLGRLARRSESFPGVAPDTQAPAVLHGPPRPVNIGAAQPLGSPPQQPASCEPGAGKTKRYPF